METLVGHSNATNTLAALESYSLAKLSPTVYIALLVGIFGVFLVNPFGSSSKIPVVNPPSRFELLGNARRQDFSRNASKYVARGRQMYPDKPFRLITDTCDLTVLPAEWASEIRNEPNLHFMRVVHDEFHADIPAFKPFAAGTADDALFQTIARKQLTKYLNQVTKPLSAETSYALDITFGTPKEWQEIYLKGSVLDLISRISSCVFLGPELCRNEAWLNITKLYTVDALFAAEELRTYPKWLRGTAQLVLAKCNRLRAHIKEARSIILPFIEKRREQRRQGLVSADDCPTAIDWFEEEAAGRSYDPALSQMILSVAAIHTSSDLLNEVILRLAVRPELVKEIREEVVRVLRSDGWTKNALYNMKLLDSVIKESQRLLTPPVQMARKAIGKVVLPDGSIIKKGQRLAVSTKLMRSPDFYEDPDEFDGHRFLRMRNQPETENQAHLVSTGPSALSFGHGQHSCPGRFFAANELKVALSHIVMKYDFKLPDGYQPRNYESSIGVNSDPMSRLVVRRHTPEVNIDTF